MSENANLQKAALTGPGILQWSGPGWFGATLGSSIFLIPTMAFLAYHGQLTLAVLPMAGFLILAMTGIVLWRIRQSIYPFSDLMYFLTLCGLLVPTIWLVIGEFALEQTLLKMNWPTTVLANTFVVCFVPLTMLGFWFRERSSTLKPK